MLKRIGIFTLLSLTISSHAWNPLEALEHRISIDKDVLTVAAIFTGTIAGAFALTKLITYISLQLEDGKSTQEIISYAEAKIKQLSAKHAAAVVAVHNNDLESVKYVIDHAPAYGEFWECYTYSYHELITHDLYLAKESVRMLERRSAMPSTDAQDVETMATLAAEGRVLVSNLQNVKDFVQALPDYFSEVMLVDQLKN